MQFGELPEQAAFGEEFCKSMSFFTRHSLTGGHTSLKVRQTAGQDLYLNAACSTSKAVLAPTGWQLCVKQQIWQSTSSTVCCAVKLCCASQPLLCETSPLTAAGLRLRCCAARTRTTGAGPRS
jgi:hypothetical protein